MADEKAHEHLPSLSRHISSENLKSSITKCQIACLSVAHTNVCKANTKFKEEFFFPVSPDDQPLAITPYERKNTVPFSVEKNQNNSKPKLLEDLEKFLEKELQILKVTDKQHNELTFLAYREVFEYLIDNFKTYKPLLSRIKNRYEMRMKQLKKQIHSMKPLKQMVATTSERYEHKIMALRDQDKQRLVQLQYTHRELSEKLSSLLKTLHDAEYSIGRLKKEIERMHEKYQQQAELRQRTIIKINGLRFQMETLEENRKQGQEDPQEDPVAIRAAISDAREREKIASHTINEMISDYTDLIPRTIYAELETKYKALSDNCDKILNEFKTLKNKQSDLLNVNYKLTEERNDYYLEYEKLKKTAIAMQHWNKCIDYINGGTTTWHEVSSGPSCQCLLEILQEMMNGNSGFITTTGHIATEATDYIGWGLDPQVPKFLRYEGPVQGNRMFVRDCYLMIADILANMMKENMSDIRMAAFVDEYLCQIIPNSEERVKWAYTFHGACQKLAQTNDNVSLFLDVLIGDSDENIYYGRQEISSNLLNTLRAAEKKRPEKEDNPAQVGFMTQEEFSHELVQFFGVTNPEDIASMSNAAVQQLQSQGQIEYAKLFVSDDEGDIGLFLTAIKDWQLEKQIDFINQLCQKFSGPVSASQFKKTLQKKGPHLSSQCIDRLVSWVFESTCEETDVTLAPHEVIDRLQHTYIPVKLKTVPKEVKIS